MMRSAKNYIGSTTAGKLFRLWHPAFSIRLPASGLQPRDRGVTLIESILAIAIIGAGLIGLMTIFIGGTKSSLVSDQSVVASNLAREKMEQIIADRANKGYATTIATNYTDGTLPGNYSNYTRTVTITEVDPNQTTASDDFLVALPGSGYARVTVVVSWGSSESVKLETLLANYTLP